MRRGMRSMRAAACCLVRRANGTSRWAGSGALRVSYPAEGGVEGGPLRSALFDRKTRGWIQAAEPALSSQDPGPEAEHFVVPVRPGSYSGNPCFWLRKVKVKFKSLSGFSRKTDAFYFPIKRRRAVGGGEFQCRSASVRL